MNTYQRSTKKQQMELVQKLCCYFQGATRNIIFNNEDDDLIFNRSNLRMLHELYRDLESDITAKELNKELI